MPQKRPLMAANAPRPLKTVKRLMDLMRKMDASHVKMGDVEVTLRPRAQQPAAAPRPRGETHKPAPSGFGPHESEALRDLAATLSYSDVS